MWDVMPAEPKNFHYIPDGKMYGFDAVVRDMIKAGGKFPLISSKENSLSTLGTKSRIARRMSFSWKKWERFFEPERFFASGF